MAPSLPLKQWDEVWVRTVIAVIAVPIVLGIVLMGSPYFDYCAWVVIIGLLREWTRLTTGVPLHPFSAYLLGITGYWLYANGSLPFVFGAVILGMIILLFSCLVMGKSLWNTFLMGAGSFYICASMATLLFFVQNLNSGTQLVLWILVLVWATDTGAYVCGRLIGGPRLAPLISPNKTWAGFVGGTIFAGIVGTVLAYYLYPTFPSFGWIFVYSLLLSIIAHVGDLMESAFKRYFGVKDAGSLIPGHGGLLDRLDSLLAVALVVGIIFYLMPKFFL